MKIDNIKIPNVIFFKDVHNTCLYTTHVHIITKKQFNSLKRILLDWKKKYPKAIIQGHRDAIETHKTCPNFDVKEWCLKNLK